MNPLEKPIRKQVGPGRRTPPLARAWQLRASVLQITGKPLPNDDGHIRKRVGRPRA